MYPPFRLFRSLTLDSDDADLIGGNIGGEDDEEAEEEEDTGRGFARTARFRDRFTLGLIPLISSFFKPEIFELEPLCRTGLEVDEGISLENISISFENVVAGLLLVELLVD